MKISNRFCLAVFDDSEPDLINIGFAQTVEK